jgi:uncharacterized protein
MCAMTNPTLVLALTALFVPTILAAQGDTTRLRWVPNPRVAAGSWVADPANHLKPETRTRIDSIVSALEGGSSAEIAVAVLDSLDGLEPADAALLLHRRWGVGKRARDNGVVLLWSPALRQTYIAVGYGLEGVIPDSRAGRIQDRDILPEFRRGNFDAGIVAGVAALAAAAREETYSGLERATMRREERPGGGVIAAIVGGAFGLIGLIAFLASGRLPRRCPRGHGFMQRLSERADDAHLDAPQRLEEQLGSVDHDVWACRRCDSTRIVPRRKLFSAYERCPECKRRTAKRTTKQLVAPTYSSTGKKQLSLACRNCGHSKTWTETVPMLVRSASGSSSGGRSGGGGGGSSFGGGSSGGGGAGRSY